MGPRSPTIGRARLLATLAAALLGTAIPGWTQAPAASPPPERLQQDRLDLQGRANFVLGAGARAFGMGGAFLARPDDATAASWNPAGLSYLRHPELSVVGAYQTFRRRTYKLAGMLSEDDDLSGKSPDFAAAAYPVELGPVSGAVQISFQRVISFTSDRTIQREVPVEIHSQGGFDVLALGTGLQVVRNLRLGATVNHWFNGYHQTLDRFVRRRSHQELDFDLSGWNVNLGAIWSPVESLNVGAVVKTAFTGSVHLSRTRTDFFSQQGAPDVVTSNAFASDAVRLDFPGAIGVGVSWRPASPLTLSADYTRTFWSGARIRSFFTLPEGRDNDPTTPEDPPRAPDDFFASLPYPTLTDPGQRDTEQARLGIEYVFIRRRLKIPLRAGAFSDRQYNLDGRGTWTAFPDAGQPPRFHGFTAGTGVVVGPLLLDVAYLYELGRYYDGTPDLLKVHSHRAYVSLIYRHGGAP